MKSLIIILMLFLFSFSKQVEDEQWYQLEHEVNSTPFTQNMIDSIQKIYNVPKVIGHNPKKCNLPKKCRAVYRINWGAANAGFAIIDDGRNDSTFFVSGKMITNRFISAFYKVRDFVYTIGDARGLYPYFFNLTLNPSPFIENIPNI